MTSGAGTYRSLVAIVSPVYRNRDTLEELHRRLCIALERRYPSFGIIFVNDACPEGSQQVLESLAARDRRVGVIRLFKNVGQQRALMIGLKWAEGDMLTVLDADLQDPPEAIPALLDALRLGYAAVFAGRRGHYESLGRHLTSRLFKRLLSVSCGVPADAGAYVAMNRLMAERIIALGEPHPHLAAMIGCTGLPVTSIAVTRPKRHGGGSAYGEWTRLRIALTTLAGVPKWKRGLARAGSASDPVENHGAELFGAPFADTNRAGMEGCGQTGFPEP